MKIGTKIRQLIQIINASLSFSFAYFFGDFAGETAVDKQF
jgi:hypothetical protein